MRYSYSVSQVVPGFLYVTSPVAARSSVEAEVTKDTGRSASLVVPADPQGDSARTGAAQDSICWKQLLYIPTLSEAYRC